MKNSASTPAESVEAYIAAQPKPFRAPLQRLRAIIKDEVPQAEELISYGIPSFKYMSMLVGIGATKDACSFYTMNPDLVERIEDELEGIRHSGGTLHFSPDEPLPEELIRSIVRARVLENEAKAAANR